MAKKRKALNDQLRAVILNSDKSRYRISRETGITQAGLSRFVNRGSGLSLATIDLVCECLELKLTSSKERKGGN